MGGSPDSVASPYSQTFNRYLDLTTHKDKPDLYSFRKVRKYKTLNPLVKLHQDPDQHAGKDSQFDGAVRGSKYKPREVSAAKAVQQFYTMRSGNQQQSASSRRLARQLAKREKMCELQISGKLYLQSWQDTLQSTQQMDLLMS